MLQDPTSLAQRTQVDTTTSQPVGGQLHCWAHACRDGEVVCGRVELIITSDTRLRLAPRERRCVAARFVAHLHPTLRTELDELARRRGAAGWRAAERMDPIELLFNAPAGGIHRITGWLEPPYRRRGDLHQIEFGLRELGPKT
jgi:hypothetical protein